MTDYMNANTINDLIRSIFAFLDKVAYWLLGIMYEILFNVASADIFSNETIKNFYGRIQLIIGVFMIFKLAVSIVQGIVNPDTFTDKKSGFSSIITRIIFALIMLTVLTPINIPGATSEYEKQLNNNGLLFGTLYSLQNRILQNNTLGRLILGTNETGDEYMSGADKQSEKLKQSANIFTSTILKGFVRINLKEDATDETVADNRVCSYIDQDTLNAYTALDAKPNQILSLINASCEYQGGGFSDILGTFKRLAGKDRYVFAYMPVISTAVAIVFIYILLGEIITIAIRTVKLAVLRLLAPIPIISYIDPKSEKDGAFGSWMKALTSTYLELFLHLAVIYFVIFLIQDMIVNGIVINTGTGIIGIISMIFIWIGLFFFIRQAPKFIKDILGVKGSSANIGLSGLLGGTAALLGGGGLYGAAAGAIGGYEAALQGANSGKGAPLGGAWHSGSDLAAQIRTGDSKAKGGILNNMNDRLMRNAGIRVAEKDYGVTANGIAVAKKRYQDLDAEAAALQDQYSRYSQGHMSADEIGRFENANAQAINDYMANGYSREDAIRAAMYDRVASAQKSAGKAKSNWEDAKKFGDTHRVTPSFEEEHRRSMRERVGLGETRGDYRASSGRRTGHQTIADRIVGSPDEWRENVSDTNPRTDNRWSPGTSGSTDTNAIHHDANMATDTIGGQGVGGGGPHHH